MSDHTNDALLDEAAFYIEYFTDTTIGKVLHADLDANDLEGLRSHLKEARDAAFNLEYQPEEVGLPCA